VGTPHGGGALEPELLRRRPDSPARLGHLAREAGLLTRGLRDGGAVAPPLTVEDEHLGLAVAALQTALRQLDQRSASSA
jgi:adenosylmethionine-8-amino-7-oxononanoate aminotransferase